jgi:very-short-patch-repair endonuclease
MTDPADKKIRAIFADHVEWIRESIDRSFAECAALCESHIERLMLARLAVMTTGHGDSHVRIMNTLWPYGRCSGPNGGPSFSPFELVVFPQAEIGRYRVDFLLALAVPHPRKGSLVIREFIVECDGHDFHEKTKEQAARDKARDRALQASGRAVFRFTGSEIFRNADDLTCEIYQALDVFVFEVTGDTK